MNTDRKIIMFPEPKGKCTQWISSHDGWHRIHCNKPAVASVSTADAVSVDLLCKFHLKVYQRREQKRNDFDKRWSDYRMAEEKASLIVESLRKRLNLSVDDWSKDLAKYAIYRGNDGFEADPSKVVISVSLLESLIKAKDEERS